MIKTLKEIQKEQEKELNKIKRLLKDDYEIKHKRYPQEPEQEYSSSALPHREIPNETEYIIDEIVNELYKLDYRGTFIADMFMSKINRLLQSGGGQAVSSYVSQIKERIGSLQGDLARIEYARYEEALERIFIHILKTLEINELYPEEIDTETGEVRTNQDVFRDKFRFVVETMENDVYNEVESKMNMKKMKNYTNYIKKQERKNKGRK